MCLTLSHGQVSQLSATLYFLCLSLSLSIKSFSLYSVCLCLSIYPVYFFSTLSIPSVSLCVSLFSVSHSVSLYSVWLSLSLHSICLCFSLFRLSFCLSLFRLSLCLSLFRLSLCVSILSDCLSLSLYFCLALSFCLSLSVPSVSLCHSIPSVSRHFVCLYIPFVFMSSFLMNFFCYHSLIPVGKR